MMRTGSVLLIIVVAALPALAAAGESSRQRPGSSRIKPRPVTSNPCAAYGAGFVQVKGTSTCIRIGGGVAVDVSGSR